MPICGMADGWQGLARVGKGWQGLIIEALRDDAVGGGGGHNSFPEPCQKRAIVRLCFRA